MNSPLRRVLADRPWQGGRVARGAQSWLPATWLGSAWSGENGQDDTLHHGEAYFHLGEGGRRGLGRKTGGVLQGNCVKKKLLEIVFKLYILCTTLFNAFSFYICRTYLKLKLFLLSKTVLHVYTLFPQACTNMFS